MKQRLPYLAALLILGIMFAGCSQDAFMEEEQKVLPQLATKTDTVKINTKDTTKVDRTISDTTKTGSNKEDSTTNNTVVNYWKIGETKHELTSCVVVEYGNRGNNTYDIELHFYTGTLKENSSAQISGSGNRLRLGIVSSQQSLIGGTYKYSSKESTPGTILDTYSIYMTGYVSGKTSCAPIMFKSGSMTVVKTANGFVIDFSLINDNNVLLTGHYEKPLTCFKR